MPILCPPARAAIFFRPAWHRSGPTVDVPPSKACRRVGGSPRSAGGAWRPNLGVPGERARLKNAEWRCIGGIVLSRKSCETQHHV
jgi:hypothetical protein